MNNRNNPLKIFLLDKAEFFENTALMNAAMDE
jgi:hypothetical protein